MVSALIGNKVRAVCWMPAMVVYDSLRMESGHRLGQVKTNNCRREDPKYMSFISRRNTHRTRNGQHAMHNPPIHQAGQSLPPHTRSKAPTMHASLLVPDIVAPSLGLSTSRHRRNPTGRNAASNALNARLLVNRQRDGPAGRLVALELLDPSDEGRAEEDVEDCRADEEAPVHVT